MKRYLFAIRITIFLIVANSAIFEIVYGVNPHNDILLIFNITRALIVMYAGWLTIVNYENNLMKASLSGPLLIFIDHVIMGGGSIMIKDAMKLTGQGINALSVFGGIVVSYLMFLPIYMLFGYIGAQLARKYSKQELPPNNAL